MANVNDGGNEPEKAKKEPIEPGLQDPGLPKELSGLGIAVSLAMLAGGFLAMALSTKLYGVGALLVCVGFGIVLAAFGGLAQGRFLNFNVVGGGAMAVALYLLLFNFQIDPLESFARGKIERTDGLIQVVGSARQNFFVGRPRKNADYEFVIFERDIESNQLYFYFQFPEGSKVKELYIGCIDSSLVREVMGSEHELILSLEDAGAEGEFRLVDNQTAKSIGKPNRTRCESDETTATTSTEVTFLGSLWTSAHAQMGETSLAEQAVKALESEDAAQRDFARTQIGMLSAPEAYRIVAESWDIAASSYRADLGRLVGWSSAIERDRKMAVYIAESLSRPQFDYLVQLTGQGDITLRQFSTEVLHRLLETTSWPQGPSAEKSQALVEAVTAGLRDPELRPIEKTDVGFSADNRLYNTIVSIGFTECNIAPTYVTGLLSAMSGLIEQFTPEANKQKTLEKLKFVTKSLQSCKP